MIQILGLRDYFDEKSQATKKKHTFFEKKWRAPSVTHLFAHIDEYIAPIPEELRENLYYTVSNCLEEPGRKFLEQSTFPVDIDDINLDKIDETIEAVLFVLKVPREKVGIVASGNGLQILIGMNHTFKDPDYFHQNREKYRAICERVDEELIKRDLPGHMDPSVWSSARLMRLPKTRNIKPGKPQREARLLNAIIENLNFSLSEISELPQVDREEQVSQIVLDKYPPPDVATILTDCEFLKHVKADSKTLPEPEWYAAASILGRMPGGAKIFDEYSKDHPSYTATNTALKLSQAMSASGPRTCKNINSLWGKCSTCTHFNSELVISPIVIRGKDYIKTKDTGFHEQKRDAQGNPKPGKPAYEDLRRHFHMLTPYVTRDESEIIYNYEKNHWQEHSDSRIRNFAQTNFEPIANNLMRSEFLGIVKSTNIKQQTWFNETIARKMNFQNGVLDMDTLELLPHSSEYGFRYVLPYKYDQHATAPRFEKFLFEITKGRSDLMLVILEFAGYAFSNDSCWAQKAMLLVGEGANGKSTLLDIFKKLAGKDNFSSLTMDDLYVDVRRYDLDGKLFNLAEETSVNSLEDTGIFKNLVNGGDTMVKKLYHQPFMIQNRAKFIFACNELPKISDTTNSIFRRLLIIPFDVEFNAETGRDLHILEKLYEELPGIFNLIIDGYKRLKGQQHFSESSTIDMQIQAYRESTNFVATFAAEKLIIHDIVQDNERFIVFDRLYQVYREYCREQGEKEDTSKMFSLKLRRIVKNYDERKTRKRIAGVQQKGLLGISFSITIV